MFGDTTGIHKAEELSAQILSLATEFKGHPNEANLKVDKARFIRAIVYGKGAKDFFMRIKSIMEAPQCRPITLANVDISHCSDNLDVSIYLEDNYPDVDMVFFHGLHKLLEFNKYDAARTAAAFRNIVQHQNQGGIIAYLDENIKGDCAKFLAPFLDESSEWARCEGLVYSTNI